MVFIYFLINTSTLIFSFRKGNYLIHIWLCPYKQKTGSFQFFSLKKEPNNFFVRGNEIFTEHREGLEYADKNSGIRWSVDLTRITSQCADIFSCSLNVVSMARIKQPRTIKNLQRHKTTTHMLSTYSMCTRRVSNVLQGCVSALPLERAKSLLSASHRTQQQQHNAHKHGEALLRKKPYC